MKKIIALTIFTCFISTVSLAQKFSDIDTGKYSIHLPDYWKPGNKIWQILTDKLPLVCDELKDKELCGDHCHPKYSIEFEMSEPVIFDYYPALIFSDNTTETWDISTLYGYKSSLLLFNEKNELLTRFILVDTNEVWRVTNRVKLISYKPAPPMKIYLLNPGHQPSETELNQQNSLRNTTGTTGQSPYAFINNNKGNLYPTQRNMLDIIDSKIKSW